MKPIRVCAAAFFAAAHYAPAAPPAAAEPPAPVRVVQPVQEYFTPAGVGREYTSQYTHIGTDCGRMGPGEHRLGWHAGAATVDAAGAGWSGVWHSLAGLAREKAESLDFARCYPPLIRDAFQPRCVGVVVRASGAGRLKLEIKSADEQTLWAATVALADGPARDFTFDLDPQRVGAAKLLNWVAEPGARLSVDRVGLVVEYPAMSFPERVFLLSYAKLARAYAPAAGLVKDHQHRPAGEFDALPATGMFALATAAAWQMGMVERPDAEQVLRDVHRAARELPRAAGLLPHFVSRPKDGAGRHAGPYRIHPGTEFSTVDTSLYYHGMLLAAQMLEDGPTRGELLAGARAVRFEHLRDREGLITHGLRDDGRTPLGWSWGDWGGETALVVLLERMAARPDLPLPRVPRTGAVPGGIGFIAEVQSLFYPHFDLDAPDALTGVNWRQARRALLQEQMDFFPRTRAGCPAAQLGLYGLSAGEAFRGRGYVANGTRLGRGDLIHPHYVLMSAPLRRPDDGYALLKQMEARGLMPPWGLVENVTPDLGEYAPMHGSLNAAFESLAAYHLAVRSLHRPNAVYQAAVDSPPLARAIEAFYPQNPALSKKD